tara:strand:+ start:84 stop:323 length:240 start_codon:yes stop_codon:yes gene_type:complete
MNEEVMDKIMKKCQEDHRFAEVFDFLLKGAQAAATIGMTTEEMATICMTGWTIGSNPDLAEMLKSITKISKLGLDIIDK